MCPGDARCPAAIQVPDLPSAAADEALDFAPRAVAAGVEDGRLEQQTYVATDGGAQRIVTSNTPVPDPPARRRPRG